MWLQCSSARSQHACPAAHTTDASSRGCLRGRYADSVLKGYATAASVILTGLLSCASRAAAASVCGPLLSTLYRDALRASCAHARAVFTPSVCRRCILWHEARFAFCSRHGHGHVLRLPVQRQGGGRGGQDRAHSNTRSTLQITANSHFFFYFFTRPLFWGV